MHKMLPCYKELPNGDLDLTSFSGVGSAKTSMNIELYPISSDQFWLLEEAVSKGLSLEDALQLIQEKLI